MLDCEFLRQWLITCLGDLFWTHWTKDFVQIENKVEFIIFVMGSFVVRLQVWFTRPALASALIKEFWALCLRSWQILGGWWYIYYFHRLLKYLLVSSWEQNIFLGTEYHLKNSGLDEFLYCKISQGLYSLIYTCLSRHGYKMLFFTDFFLQGACVSWSTFQESWGQWLI